MKYNKKQLLILLVIGLCSGCNQIQDMVIRSMHMDYDYRGELLPRIFDRYQQKMKRQEPVRLEPLQTLPDFMDQG